MGDSHYSDQISFLKELRWDESRVLSNKRPAPISLYGEDEAHCNDIGGYLKNEPREKQ